MQNPMQAANFQFPSNPNAMMQAQQQGGMGQFPPQSIMQMMNNPFQNPNPNPISLASQPSSQLSQQYSDKEKVFVGDIDDTMTESQLQTLFASWGVGSNDLVEVKVLKKKNQENYGVVVLKTPENVNKAIVQCNHRFLPNSNKPIRVMKFNQQQANIESNVFLKNIEPEINIQELQKQLMEIGPISSIKFGTNNQGQLLGYGYVQFESKEIADKCIEDISNIQIQQTPLQASKYLDKSQRSENRTNLYLKNLPETLTESELQELIEKHFSNFGSIASILVKKQSIGGALKPFAFICFQETSSAEEAMKFCKDADIFNCGIALYMNWAESRKDRIKKLKEIQSQGSEKILYTKNLKLEVTSEFLKEIYSRFGAIEYCNVKEPKILNPAFQKKTKFGYLFFTEKDSAKKAQIDAKDNVEILNLYEDNQLYLNNLLNKETFSKYKQALNKKQENKQSNDQSSNMTQLQPFMQMMMFFAQLMQQNQQPGSGSGMQQPQQVQKFNFPRQPRQQGMGDNQFRQQQFPNNKGYQQRNNQNSSNYRKPFPQQQQQQQGNQFSNQMNSQQFQQQPQQYQQQQQQRSFQGSQMPQMPQMGSQIPPPMPHQMGSQIPPQMPILSSPPQMPPSQMLPQQIPSQQQQSFLAQQQQKFGPMPSIQQPGQMLLQQQPMQPMQQPQQPLRPQVLQQPQPMAQQYKSVVELRADLNSFLQLSQDEQRKILGEMLFPQVKSQVSDQQVAPKITGMLIDFEVFEVADILEMLETTNVLQDQIKEAQELINSQTQ